MTKEELNAKVASAKTETHDALNTVWSELNNGQQKKLLKNENVAEILRRYGVIE